MTLATRALFTGPVGYALPPGPVTLTSSPDGGWTQVTEPKAIRVGSTLFFCFIDGDDGHIKVGKFSYTDGSIDVQTVGTAPDPVVVDIHNAPVIAIRADGRIVVAWAGHNSSEMYVVISTNAYDITAWGSTTDIDASLGGGEYTYPSLVWLGTDLYLFYRDYASSRGRVAYAVSSDGGATWGAQTVLASPPATGYGHTCYFVVCSDGSRIDVALSPTHVQDADVTIHHLYYDGAWKAADGTSLGSPTFSAEELPTVYGAGDGSGWPNAIVPGPAFMYTVDLDTDWAYRLASYDSGWTLEQVGLAGQASIVIVQGTLTDADTVFGSVLDGSYLELARWDRSGSSWVKTQRTDGSSEHNIYAARVHDSPTSEVLWLAGTYDAEAHDTDYSQGIRMWR